MQLNVTGLDATVFPDNVHGKEGTGLQLDCVFGTLVQAAEIVQVHSGFVTVQCFTPSLESSSTSSYVIKLLKLMLNKDMSQLIGSIEFKFYSMCSPKAKKAKKKSEVMCSYF